jgi:hypothetical protein
MLQLHAVFSCLLLTATITIPVVSSTASATATTAAHNHCLHDMLIGNWRISMRPLTPLPLPPPLLLLLCIADTGCTANRLESMAYHCMLM